jgi:hypothetical protein
VIPCAGIALTAYCSREGKYEVDITDPDFDQVKIIWFFILFSLCLSLVCIPLQNYRPQRPYALCLFAIFTTFLFIAILRETGVISTIGF